MDTWTPDEVWERGAGPEDAGLRLDRFWGRELAGLGVSRQRVKQWIGLGLARVDGRVCLEADLNLVGGERLVLVAGPALAAAGPEQGEVDLVHADEDLLVVDKPAGLTTHPAPSQPENTLAQRLAGRFPGLARMDAWRPGIVHRLDKDTSGLLVVALNEAARLRLARDFELRRVSKAYLAVVLGRPDPDRGLIDAPIARHPRIRTRMAVSARDGREARSAYRVLWTDPGSRASLLMVRIFTGRTHQIRVHLAHLGHPLLGDAVYGGPENRRFRERFPGPGGLARRQMLHAFRLAFRHPATGRDMDFFAPPPEDFSALVAALERSCLRVAVIGAAGSGKSALLACLAEQGQAVFSADQFVARAYAAGGDGALLLERRFGSRFLAREGGVDRAVLFKAMAGDPGLRREVMDLVHPLVEHGLRGFWAANQDRDLAFAELPLFLEQAWAEKGLADELAGVFCPESLRLGPLARARGLSPERLAVFDSWQWPTPDKLGRCGLIVDNSGDIQGLRERAAALIRAGQGLAASRAGRFEAWLDRLWERLGREDWE